MTASAATLRGSWRPAPFDRLLLWLALLQGSSMTLSFALYLPSGQTPLLATLVSALWALMYVLAAVRLFAAFGLNWLTWLVRYRLLLTVIVAGTAFSALWSIAPWFSVERGAHLIGTTLLALYLGLRLPLSEILHTSARAFALLLVLSALAALLYPPLGIEDYQGRAVWRGVLASKNTLGFWAAVAVLLFATRAATAHAFAARLGNLAFVALALVVLAKSVSATSALALALALSIMLYLHVATELKLGQLAMAVLAALVAGLIALACGSIDTAELIGRSGDLTGRSQVWAETWRLILERPFGGYGYGTLWFPTDASLWIQQSLTDLNWIVFHAHNGLLQIASEVGLPLTVLTVLFVVQQLVESVWCQYRRPQPGVLFVLGYSVALLVSNYAEARLLGNRDLYWIFLVALPISMLRQVTLVAGEAATSPAPLAPPYRAAALAERHASRAHRRDLKRRLRARRADAFGDVPNGGVGGSGDGGGEPAAADRSAVERRGSVNPPSSPRRHPRVTRRTRAPSRDGEKA